MLVEVGFWSIPSEILDQSSSNKCRSCVMYVGMIEILVGNDYRTCQDAVYTNKPPFTIMSSIFEVYHTSMQCGPSILWFLPAPLFPSFFSSMGESSLEMRSGSSLKLVVVFEPVSRLFFKWQNISISSSQNLPYESAFFNDRKAWRIKKRPVWQTHIHVKLLFLVTKSA